ncbi:MAG: hypothetical protein K6A33_06940 [Clostridiales bacterium]|nr:hypothetical protein [Clostridiales bacterium]
MKRNVAILAVLWIAIAAVWYAGFRWESWIAAPEIADRAVDTPGGEPVIYVIPESDDHPVEEVTRVLPESPPTEEVLKIRDEPEAGTVYVVNTKTKKIHLPTCSSVGDIKPENRSESDDPDTLIAEGYAWCKKCHG